MRIIGLTGGIASGKSTVHAMLTDLGAHVLDADAIYHELVAPVGGAPSALATAIGKRFPGVVAADGTLDRAALGKIVFNDEGQRRQLNALTHPAVAAAFKERVDALAAEGVTTVFYDVPLLYENGLEKGMDVVIVVWVPRDLQVARLMERAKITEADAKARVASQMPLDTKSKKATWVIDNSGRLARTRRVVKELWRELGRAAAIRG
ncbi:MAG TPA: dephospho-CoA kinase [Myxococcota bacterium]|nr:dephospho-CoA kinase [Myxococcota bacterium]